MEAPCPDIAAVNVVLARHDERMVAASHALGIATAELARRLDALNHAHAQATQDRASYVRVERFDAEALRLAEKLEEAKSTADARFGRLERFEARVLVIAALLATLISATIAVTVPLLLARVQGR